jgi:hypothetical protein
MKKNRLRILIIVLMMVLVSGTVFHSNSYLLCQDLTGPYLGQQPPGMTPQIFVPDELRSNADWWWHGALAFTPDGQELYMDIYVPANNLGIQIRYMRMENNVWTSPQPTAFSSLSCDASPSFTDEGNKVFFISDRPGGSIWTSTRTQSGWSAPSAVYFPWPSSLGGGWELSATKDETLYLRMRILTAAQIWIFIVFDA